MATTKIEERGRIIIPKEIRRKLGLHTGERLRITLEEGAIVVRPEQGTGALEKLKGCIAQGENPLDAKKIWNA